MADGAHGRLVVAHHGALALVRVGHDGGHGHTAGRPVQLQPVQGHTQACDQHTGQLLFDAAHHVQRRRARRGQQHGRGTCLLEGLQHLVQVVAAHIQCHFGGHAGVVFLHFGDGHLVHFAAIAVVQIHHRNPLEAHAHQALHQALHLLGVARAHVEHIALVLAQRGSAADGRHMRDAGGFDQRGDGGVVRGAHAG